MTRKKAAQEAHRSLMASKSSLCAQVRVPDKDPLRTYLTTRASTVACAVPPLFLRDKGGPKVVQQWGVESSLPIAFPHAPVG